jgi:magnesium-transporting ATPase (P-type)
LIEVRSGDIMPCDAIILEGFCNVNESDLTGESNLVMKSSIPKDEKKFSYSRKKHLLYQGTTLNKCESNDSEGIIKVLAVNTGYNTLRGNLIQNILFPKQSNFNLFKDLKYYFLSMVFIYLVTIILIICFFLKFTKTPDMVDNCIGLGTNSISLWGNKELIQKCFDSLTIVLPPTLPISLTFTSFYFHLNLNRKFISCISDFRMTAAGRVNIFVLDKTGTLTEQGLELYGFQVSKNSLDIDNHLCFDDIETDTNVYNQVHKFFWKSFCKNPSDKAFDDYKHNLQNNVIYFLECLATCHTIDKIKGETLGNSVDKRIFDCLNWNLENVKDIEINQVTLLLI